MYTVFVMIFLSPFSLEKHPYLHIAGMNHRIAFTGAAVINKIELHVAAQRALDAESPGEIAAGL